MKRVRVAIFDERGAITSALRRAKRPELEIRVIDSPATMLKRFVDDAFDAAVLVLGPSANADLLELSKLGQALVVVFESGAWSTELEAVKDRVGSMLAAPVEPTLLVRAVRRAANAPSELAGLTYRQALERARHRAAREYLTALMRECGNVTHAAERAGIERESLHRLLRRYGLRPRNGGEKGSGP